MRLIHVTNSTKTAPLSWDGVNCYKEDLERSERERDLIAAEIN